MGCVFSKPSEGDNTREGAKGLQVQHNEYFNNNKHQVSMNHRATIIRSQMSLTHCSMFDQHELYSYQKKMCDI